MKKVLLGVALGVLGVTCVAWTQDGYKFRVLYSQEPVVTLHGSGALVDGKAVVEMPAWFPIKCTLTDGAIMVVPTGSWSPLFVTPVDATHFKVQTTDAGVKTQAFGWEVRALLKEPNR